MNQIEQSAKLYSAINSALQVSKEPLCALDLYDIPDVRKFAKDANQISTYLSNLYKAKGVGRVRFTHPKARAVRFAYSMDKTLPTVNVAPRNSKVRKAVDDVTMSVQVTVGGVSRSISLADARKLCDNLNKFFTSLQG